MTTSKHNAFAPKLRRRFKSQSPDKNSGMALNMLRCIVPDLNLFLHAQARGIQLTLEMSTPVSGLIHIGGNQKDFLVILLKVRGDSVLAFDGKELFLAGDSDAAMQRLSDFLITKVDEVAPLATAEVTP